jgi:hypothetical protein
MWQKRFSQSGDEGEPKTIHLDLSLGCLKSWKDWAEGWSRKPKTGATRGASDAFESKLKEARQ